MKTFKENKFWTSLEIWIFDENIDENHIKNIFQIIDNFEEKYSRFKKWNYLWELNNSKKAKIDDDLKTIITIAKNINEISKWYFDLTVLPFLENIWYGIYDEKIDEKNFWMENIFIEKDEIFLKNNIMIEIWWIWKGYMVDVIFDNLKKNYNNFVINFGWDIRISWEKREFFLEDPIDNEKFIWKIEIDNLALASSGSSKRKTEKWHHLINPKSGKSTNEVVWVYVTHKFACFADSFATTFFVCPVEISLEILKKISGLEAMIITKNWEIYKSKWFNFIK